MSTEDIKEHTETINKIIQNNNDKIRENYLKMIKKSTTSPRSWMNKEGMCEICGINKASVNLELKYGSHRECYSCWND